ncbi:MAG: hypothetical protein JXB38_22925 [Anaerolineales bacterium]|nr:hypothetical protein [Anaerolineales bacterium]
MELKDKLVKLVTRLVIIIFCLLFVVLCIAPLVYAIGSSEEVSRNMTDRSMRKYADPITPEVKADLCAKFEIPSNNKVCNPKRKILAPDFYDVIEPYLLNQDSGKNDFDYVEGVLGEYCVECWNMRSHVDEPDHYTCRYDIAGDEVFILIIQFDGDGHIDEIIK